MKKLIKQAVVRGLIFAVVSAIVAAIDSSAVFTNEIALKQMENSNTPYIWMNFIQYMRPIMVAVYICFAVLIFWPVARDLFKIIKNKHIKEEESK